MLIKRRGRPPSAGMSVAALDIGTHKVCCLIAALEPSPRNGSSMMPRLRVLGLGHQRSQGIAGGVVVDLALAQSAVAAAVAQAEHAAGFTIDQVYVGVTGGNPRSRTFNGHVDLPQGIVGDADVARLDAGARDFAGGRTGGLLTINRIAFGLDATPAIREPRGLAGRRLRANHHAITVEPGPLQNLCMLVASCHLGVVELIPAAYASALASTTEDERRLGVTCIDIGAGVTSIAGFADGHFVHGSSVPFGGQHVTSDIAHTLAIPLAEAERIKTLYGSLAVSASDEHDLVPVARVCDHAQVARVATRAEVGRLLARRHGSLLAGVRASLDGCGVERIRTSAIVLTGGASQLMGLEAWAVSVLQRPVRVAVPPRLDGGAGRLSSGASSRAFACVVGLALAACGPSPWISAGDDGRPARQGYLGRVEQWLKESF